MCFSGDKLIKKWRNIKDNYCKSEEKRSKYGQSANFGRRYIYARQLSFLQSAGATTENQNSLDETDEYDGLEVPEQPTEEADKPPRYDQGTSKKRKRDIESSLIDFLNAPVSVQTIPTPALEPNPDMFFFQSILPTITNLTEDQKLEFRCEVLNIIKRLRAAPNIQPNVQPNIQPYIQPKIQYNTPAYPSSGLPHYYSPQPTFHQNSTHSTPTQNFSSYLHLPRSQQSSQRCTQPLSISVSSLQSHDSGQHYNPISPCSTIASSEENSIDIQS